MGGTLVDAVDKRRADRIFRRARKPCARCSRRCCGPIRRAAALDGRRDRDARRAARAAGPPPADPGYAERKLPRRGAILAGAAAPSCARRADVLDDERDRERVNRGS